VWSILAEVTPDTPQTGNVIAARIGVPSVPPCNVGLFARHGASGRAGNFTDAALHVLNTATGGLARSG
jgi:filamentous hemagglutinin